MYGRWLSCATMENQKIARRTRVRQNCLHVVDHQFAHIILRALERDARGEYHINLWTVNKKIYIRVAYLRTRERLNGGRFTN